MRQPEKIAALCCALFLSLALLGAEEPFGFAETADGADAAGMEGGSTGSAPISLNLEISAGTVGFTDELDSYAALNDFDAGSFLSGRLDMSARGENADAVVKLLLSPAGEGESPFAVDEAYARAYFGKLDIEGGLRKLTWGKADSQGPLDVVNPEDLTDLTVTDQLERKIARPMLHASWSAGSFTKVEGVILPSFEGHRIDTTGRWTPAQASALPAAIIASVNPAFQAAVASAIAGTDFNSLYPETSALEYLQAGARLTSTFGSYDVGLQYFYGNLARPAISVTGYDELPPDLDIRVEYNRYHQIGVDAATVIGGFNLRSELGANITSDLSGKDGAVYNPSLVWSMGFDHGLPLALSLNAQCAGSVRLLDSGVSDTIDDTEAGTEATHTTVTLIVTRTFFRDALELKMTGLFGLEDADYLVLPSMIWTRENVALELSGGFFGGNDEGEMGQYRDNDYLKVALTCSF